MGYGLRVDHVRNSVWFTVTGQSVFRLQTDLGKVSNLETDWELLFYRRVWLPVRLSNVNDCQIWSPLGTEDVREQNF